jgi:hypothetical protein
MGRDFPEGVEEQEAQPLGPGGPEISVMGDVIGEVIGDVVAFVN